MAEASIALNRFGLGARPDEAAPADPRRWLLAQMRGFDPAVPGAPTSAAVATELVAYQDTLRSLRQNSGEPRPRTAGSMPPAAGMDPAAQAMRDATQAARRVARLQGDDHYAAAVGARATAALTTPAPFVERLVHFWANHFAVSADKLELIGLSGTLEFEAIRPHVLGRFGDMLGAVERHPAMLLYLDQAQSIGPTSPLGTRVAARGRRRLGLNENLAREIMELHTLGVRSVYTQQDVTEFARAMTGWTTAGLTNGQIARATGTGAAAAGEFVLAPALHEPGVRTIMGKPYAQRGEGQAQAVLSDLALHPATARHVATKLARHFAGDVPPPAMVARLETAFLGSGGDLPTVYRAIIASPEAWVAAPPKFRTPWEWSIAALRAMGYREVPPEPTVGLLQQLGQPTWRPGSPAGYDDIAASWAGPDSVLRRVEAAERLASRATLIDARRLGPTLFPAALSGATAQAIARADSPGQALALLLVSPDMMRR